VGRGIKLVEWAAVAFYIIEKNAFDADVTVIKE
jgi:hypothetical protein